MIKSNKAISLLICGIAASSFIPTSAVNASIIKLEEKEGTIYDAKAYANGLYLYDGYKDENSETGTYYSTPKGDMLIDDVTGLGERYGMNYINFKKDDKLFNLLTGKAEEESEENRLVGLESRFIHKVLNRANRYENYSEENFKITEKLALDNYSSIWYEGKIGENEDGFTVYINDKGDYIDASESLNIVYYDADGKKGKTRYI